VTTTNLESVPDAAHRDDATAFQLPELRRRRQELLTERSRSRYLYRLVKAQMDVTIASVAGLQDCLAPAWHNLPTPPSASEVGALLTVPGQDLGSRLQSLREALNRLARYDDALSAACETATDDLVTALVKRPNAFL